MRSVSEQAPHQFAIQVAVSGLIGAATVIATMLTVNWQVTSSTKAIDKQIQAAADTAERQQKAASDALERQLRASAEMLERQTKASFDAIDRQIDLQQKQWEKQNEITHNQHWREEQLRVIRDLRATYQEWVADDELLCLEISRLQIDIANHERPVINTTVAVGYDLKVAEV